MGLDKYVYIYIYMYMRAGAAKAATPWPQGGQTARLLHKGAESVLVDHGVDGELLMYD